MLAPAFMHTIAAPKKDYSFNKTYPSGNIQIISSRKLLFNYNNPAPAPHVETAPQGTCLARIWSNQNHQLNHVSVAFKGENMRSSFTILCLSTSILAINSLLQTFGDIRGFLGLYPFDTYPRAICQILYYLSLLMFCSRGYAILKEYQTTAAPCPAKNPQLSPAGIAGIAVSSLLSAFFVFAIAIQMDNVPRAALVYLLFLLTCGLLIQPSANGVLVTALYAIWPALFFLLAALSLLLLGVFLEEALVVSGKPGQLIRDTLPRLLAVSTGLAILSVPGIAAASLGRQLVFDLLLSFAHVSPSVLNQLKQNISIGLAGMTLIATAILGMKVMT